MPKCKKCNQPALTKSEFCKTHQPDNVAKKEKELKEAKEREAKKLEDRKPVMNQMAIDAKKKEDQLKLRNQKIAEIATAWNQKVQAVVTQVKHLRSLHPENTGINAGKNKGIGDTEGGTDNPVVFAMPSNTFKISAGEVYSHMKGFEGSDSGSFKFRVDGVFVHAH